MPSEHFNKGREIRTELTGKDYVENALKDPNDFSYPMEQYVTESCWGAIWGRPGLDRRSRSIVNIAMIAVLNRPDALAGHIKTGIKNGLSREEIQEILLQVACYGGMPAGMASFAVGKKALKEIGL